MIKAKTYKNNVLSGHYFCVDIETTGLDPKAPDAGILEVYFKIMYNGEIEKEYYKLFYHPAFTKTQHIHQIPAEELEGKPLFINSKDDIHLLRHYFRRCADASDDLVFMAHYSPFEYKWFKHFLDLDNEDWTKNIKTCDPRYIAKFLFPDEPHNLIKLCEKFDIAKPEGQHDFHRADQDVKAMYELFTKLEPLIPEKDLVDFGNKTKFDFDEPHDKSILYNIKKFFKNLFKF